MDWSEDDHACFFFFFLVLFFESLDESLDWGEDDHAKTIITQIEYQVTPGKAKTREEENRMELVDLLEAITYVLCHDQPLTEETFHRVFSARGVPSKLMRVLSRGSRLVEVGELMNFIMTATINQGSKLSEEAEESLRKVFFSTFFRTFLRTCFSYF